MQWSVLPLLAGLAAVLLIFGGAPTASPPAVSGPTTLIVVDPDGNILDYHGLRVMDLLEREYGGDVVTPFAPLSTLVLMAQADAYASEMEDWTGPLSNLSVELERASLAASFIAGVTDPRCVDLPSELAEVGLWEDAVVLLSEDPGYGPRILGLIAALKLEDVDSDGTFMEISALGEWDAVEPTVSSRGALLMLLRRLDNRTESAVYSLEQGLGEPGGLSAMLAEGLNSSMVGRIANATVAAESGNTSGVRRNLTDVDGLLSDVSSSLVALTYYNSTQIELIQELRILNYTLNAIWDASLLLQQGESESALDVLQILGAKIDAWEAHLASLAELGEIEAEIAILAPLVSADPLRSLLSTPWSESAADAALPLSGLEGDQSALSGALIVIGDLDDFEPWTIHPEQPSMDEARGLLMGDPVRALGICSRILESGASEIGRGLEIASREQDILNDIYESVESALSIIGDTELGREFGVIEVWSLAWKFRLGEIEEEFALLTRLNGERDRLGAWLGHSFFGGMGLSFAAGAIILAEDRVEDVVETLRAEGLRVDYVGPGTVSEDLLSSYTRILMYSTVASFLATLLYSHYLTSSLRISLLASLIPPAASYGALRLGHPGVLEASFMHPSLGAVSSMLTLLTIYAVSEKLNTGFGRREALAATFLKPGVWHVSMVSAAILGISSPLFLTSALLTAALILGLPVPGFLLLGSGRRRIPPAGARGPLVRLTVLCYRNRYLALAILALLLVPIIWIGSPPGPLDYLPLGSKSAEAVGFLVEQASVPGPVVLDRSPPSEGGFLNLTLVMALVGTETGRQSYAYFQELDRGWLGTAILGGAPDPGPGELWILILMMAPFVLAVRRVGLLPSLFIIPFSLASIGILGLLGLPAPPTMPLLSPLALLVLTAGWAEFGVENGHPLDFKKRLTWRFQGLVPAALASILPLATLAVLQGRAGLSTALSSFLAIVSALPAFSALSSISAGNH